jgi:hypothetical protein
MKTPQKGAGAGAKAEPDEKDVGKGQLTHGCRTTSSPGRPLRRDPSIRILVPLSIVIY